MGIDSIIVEIDAEIERLQEARMLLSSLDGAMKEAPAPARKVARRRRLSASARKHIADVQRKRWAAVRAEKVKRAAPAKKVSRTAPAKKAAVKKPLSAIA